MKRLSAELDHDGAPSKRLCCTHTEDNDPDNVVASQRQLDLLPTEILLMILEFSLEPSLIHASRRLYHSLPSFVPFSKALAFSALSPRHPREHGLDAEPLFRAIPKSLETEQDRIRQVVFASAWFQERHLRHVHHKLLHSVIVQACAHSKDGPSRGQKKRIKSFVTKETSFSTLEQLNLRLRDDKNRPLNLHSTPLSVNLTAQHTTSILRPINSYVISFEGSVPNFLLHLPLTSSKLKLLQHISERTTRCTNRSQRLISCDRRLLGKAFLSSIVEDDPLACFTLFTIEALLDDSDDNMVLTNIHLEAAVKRGQTRMLIAILKRMWRYPRAERPSDADLIDLINRARHAAWPEWPKTTRICAMETASVWKAKQVEDAGGKVSHIPHAWPPELKICLPGRRVQTWFIPRDYRYDVDWENSSLGPWRPLGMYKDFTFLGASAFAVLWNGVL